MSRQLRFSVLLGVLLIVSACGGSGASAGPGTNPTAGTNPTPGEPEASGGGTGGGSSIKACDLLTTAEVEAATGQSGIGAQATAAGDFEGASQCAYVSNSVLPVVVLTVESAGANTDLNSFEALPGTVLFNLNDAAGAWVPASGPIAFIVKHDVAVALAVYAPVEGKDPQAVGEDLAQKVADRMP